MAPVRTSAGRGRLQLAPTTEQDVNLLLGPHVIESQSRRIIRKKLRDRATSELRAAESLFRLFDRPPRTEQQDITKPEQKESGADLNG